MAVHEMGRPELGTSEGGNLAGFETDALGARLSMPWDSKGSV